MLEKRKGKSYRKGILLTGVLLSVLVAGLWIGTGEANAAAKALNVETHTKDEIIAYIQSHTGALEDTITYGQEPVTTAPYSAGKLSDATQQYGLAALNEVRYIAGIYHEVTADDTYVSQAQAGALINYVNRQLSHTPSQPEGMSDDMYQLGYLGTSRGNIVWSSGMMPLGKAVIHSWMADEDSGNIDRVGHRRWCLNPSMGKTGFGAVTGSNGTYGVMYAFDRSHTVTEDPIVAWPARNMPVEYFDSDYPWSISSGTAFSDDVSVKVTRVQDHQEWNFSSSAADGYFNYSKGGYGQYYCLIFRPSGISGYFSGDEYQVEVMENGEITLDYTVSFFNIEEIPEDTTITLSSSTGKVSVSQDGYYYGVASISISNPDISADKLSVTSSDETVARAMVSSAGSRILLFVKGIKDGVAKITVSLSREIKADFYVTVGTGEDHVHTYDVQYTIDKEATCEGEGSKSRHCTGCGAKTDITVIPAKGHSYGEWTVTKAATSTEAGEKEHSCIVCGVTETEIIPASGEISENPSAQQTVLETGTVVREAISKAYYKVTAADTAEYQKPTENNAVSHTIPASVVLNGTTYRVTSVADDAFRNMKNLTRVVIGSNVTAVGAKAFSGCSRLKTVTMGKNVTTIGAKAFYKCVSLTRITIPSRVSQIGKQAFYGCKKLKSITVKTKKLTTKNVGKKAFQGIYANAVIRVPKANLKQYRKLLQTKGAGRKITIRK